MIKVTFDSQNYELMVSGHANYEEKGKDIVCAAVSILFYTLHDSLNKLDEKALKEPIEKVVDKDYSLIACKPSDAFQGNVALLFWMALNGIELLANDYPDHVSLEVK